METLMYWPFWILGAYLLGAFPSSYLAGHLLGGLDLRRHGSGNLGATNAFRVLGSGAGAVVLGVDVIKGLIPVYCVSSLAGVQAVDSRSMVILQILVGTAAVAGHILNPFFRFKGGKGVATATGVFLGICPAAVSLSFCVWLLLMAVFRIVSLASLGAAFGLPLFVYLTVNHNLSGYEIIQVFSAFITLVAVITHRSNIGRLIRGKEKRLSRGGRTLQ
jgi:acyl phosphate:glycerol-3-phosphate acyltransferase